MTDFTSHLTDSQDPNEDTSFEAGPLLGPMAFYAFTDYNFCMRNLAQEKPTMSFMGRHALLTEAVKAMRKAQKEDDN